MFMKRFCAGLALLLIIHISNGQSHFFSTLGVNHGLPSNITNSIAQDTHHFIWIGTDNGLARYDGYQFKTFKKEDQPRSLPTNEISSLLVDGDFLWVGTWRGLCKINTMTFEVERLQVQGSNVIRCLSKDREGNVWVGTANGLVKIQRGSQEQYAYTKEGNGLSHNTIRSIYEDKLGNIWVGTYDKLNKLSPGAVDFTTIDLKGPYKPELKNNLICDIKPYSKDDSILLIGTETGLCFINIRSHEYTRYDASNTALSNEVVKTLYEGPDDQLWLGTDFGLNLFDVKTRKATGLFHNPQLMYSIASNVIWQIFQDDGGVIWLVTSNGLSRANKHNQFFSFQEISYRSGDQNIGNQVKAMLVARNGDLWMATIHGVVKQEASTGVSVTFESDSPKPRRILLNNVYALEEDEWGRIWIGTAAGINIWDPSTQTMNAITATPENGLTSNYIAKFVKGKDGSFWVSAWEGGLHKVSTGFREVQRVRFEFAGDFASEKVTYAMNAIWTLNNDELFRIDLNSFQSRKVDTFNTLAKGHDIYNLYATDKGVLWAGTTNGLIEYNPSSDSAKLHPVQTGKESVFNNIISDSDENLWAAAQHAILKYNPATGKTVIFPLDKELPLKTFYSNCSALTPDGMVLFGGDNGFIRFSPGIKASEYQPNVFLTSIMINNKAVAPLQSVNEKIILTTDIAYARGITLDYSHRSITFDFSSLHYWRPEINVYAYRMEGFDDEWTYVAGSKNFAVYSNLPAGDYTFRVKATNNYGAWSPNEVSLAITIAPPVLLSWPFVFIYAVVIGLLVLLALRIYTVRLKLKNEVRIAVLQKNHAEEIVATKQNFFTSISHELRTPISLIVPPIQEIIKRDHLNQDDRTLLTIAEKNAQRLLRLINQILDYRKLEHENQSLKITWFDAVAFGRELYSMFSDRAARKQIEFSFETSMSECPLWADKEKVEIIIFNLLSNAFKFTPKKGRIHFLIKEQADADFPDGVVVFIVSDTGIGIPKQDQEKIFTQFYQTTEAKKYEDGSGIGLTLVSEYTKMHKGKISVTSEPGQGSTFGVLLPLGSGHFPVDKNQTYAAVDLTAVKDQGTPERTYEFNLKTDKPVVLLVEDNVDMIEFITVSLSEKYHFITGSSGVEGLQKAKSATPDVIVSDIMMPEMDGLEFCKLLKGDDKTSHIPIILLTAKSLTSQKVEGIRSGADIYLTKPFDIDVLEAHIDHLLQRREELAQYFRNELVTQPVAVPGKENEDDRFLKRVMNTIESNIGNPDFTVEQLSEVMGMSTTHLYRKLKSLTHLSANEIIKKYRIKKASILLKNKEGNITEIMYEIGFSNLSYFSKCFKTEFGVTPKEYQQRESRHSFDVGQTLGHPDS
jgi:signal transduction histidine kinase/ligand-binding sensor domain-containing protein/DNA-binding response OmpR family regulator